MLSGRPISEICRELAESAQAHNHDVLAQILRMAALEAAENGARHHDLTRSVRDLLVGTWDWDIVSDRVFADAPFAAIFGISTQSAADGVPLKRWLDAIHPADVADVVADIDRALTTGSVFSREYRVCANGQTRWVYARGKCTLNTEGISVRFPGAIVDITREKLDDPHPSIVPG